jgi:tetratricopeptide (TPR) repeat protein
MKDASVVMTGEGRLDRTSFFGKAPIELAKLAQRASIPTAFVCADAAAEILPQARRCGVHSVATFSEAGARRTDSFRKAAFFAKKAAAIALLSLALPVCGATFSEIDDLYFHRDQPAKLEQSLEKLGQALAASPDSAELLWKHGRSLVRMGGRPKAKKERLKFFEQARGELERSVAINSKDPQAHYWLGMAFGRIGQEKGIFKALFLVGKIRGEMEKTLALDPAHAGACRVLGELYDQLPGFAGGDPQKALVEFEKAVNSSPNDITNYTALAEAYRKAGRVQDAKAVLERGLAVTNPADPAEAVDDQADMRRLERQLR